ncbi:MAG TPA: diacylglycerol kinase family protein [Polyangia bacterium]|nr:diacylglycerol kinase family protein [Polyangia bacterium]
MQQPVVIVNPRSGGGLSQRRWAALLGPLTDGLGPVDVRFTEARGDGRRIAHEEATAGRGLIVAMGGDGTISEVADGILDAGGTSELGVIPRGTGGDFRRSLDLDDDLGQAARRIRDTPARLIDAGRVSFVADDGSPAQRHFVNVVSFGFSSDVARQANASSKRLGGRVAFLSATVRSLVSYDNVDVVLSVDDRPERRMSLLLAAVGNGRFFGGGMKICPEAVLDDGLFDLVTVGNLGRVGVMANIHRIYSGHHLTMKEVQGTRGRRVKVAPADPEAKIPLEVDGETPGHLPAHFELLPGALRVRA